MTNPRCISQIKFALESINKSFDTIDHHLAVSDNGQARFEMEHIMALITALHDRLSNLENIGRQPEEILTINNT